MSKQVKKSKKQLQSELMHVRNLRMRVAINVRKLQELGYSTSVTPIHTVMNPPNKKGLKGQKSFAWAKEEVIGHHVRLGGHPLYCESRWIESKKKPCGEKRFNRKKLLKKCKAAIVCGRVGYLVVHRDGRIEDVIIG